MPRITYDDDTPPAMPPLRARDAHGRFVPRKKVAPEAEIKPRQVGLFVARGMLVGFHAPTKADIEWEGYARLTVARLRLKAPGGVLCGVVDCDMTPEQLKEVDLYFRRGKRSVFPDVWSILRSVKVHGGVQKVSALRGGTPSADPEL